LLIFEKRRKNPFDKTADHIGDGQKPQKYHGQADQLIAQPGAALGAQLVFEKADPAEIIDHPFRF